MRRLGLLGVLLVGLLGFTLLQPALADDETVTLDFDHEGTTDATYTIEAGELATGHTGQGLVDDEFESGPFGETYIARVAIDLPEDCTVTDVAVWVKHTKLANNTISILTSLDGDDLSLNTLSIAFDTWAGTSTTAAGDPLDVEASTVTIEAAFADPGNTGASMAMDDIVITCGAGGGGDGSRTRPISTADEHPDWGMFDYEFANSLNTNYQVGYEVEAFSATFGANVAAVSAGTVLSVTPYTPLDCPSAGFMNLHFCYVPVPAPFTGNGFNQLYALEMVQNWRVVIQDSIDPTITYSYIVHNPTVEDGDEVVAGCVIGQTIQVKKMPFDAVTPGSELGLGISISGNLGFVSEPTEAGVTLITMYQAGDEGIEPTSLYPSLTEQPDLSDCQARQLSACMNENPNLTDFSYYERESDVTLLEGGGVTIPSFNYIMQREIMIDPDVDYILSVQARKRETGDDTDSSTMNLQMGSELESFDVLPSYHNYTFTPSGDDWHDENFTQIIISNQPSSIAPIEIKYICLAPVTASTAPGSCYFANNEFDADGSGWDISATTFGTGQAFMRDDSTLEQTVTLMPDEGSSHFYTIRAVARLIATGSYTGQIGKSVALNYRFPVLGDFTEVGTIDSALVEAEGKNLISGNVEFDHPFVLETTLEITEETNSSFTFQVVVEDEDDYIQGMRLDSVCIDPEGDGTFPGQDGGGGYTPPFIVGCSIVPTPSENSIGPWIFYHWANLRRFFSCDLMKLLNKWFNLFDQFRITILKVARYWIALVQRGSTWLTSFIWWLNGSFRNIAMGQVTTINEAGGCHDFFCAIVDVVTTLGNLLSPIVAALQSVVGVLLGVFVGVVNLFFTLIQGLVSFVVALLIRLFGFVNMAISLLTGLIGAYNSATPTAIPGLPTCAIDPESSPLCWFFWVSDNTFFQGRWNVLYTVILSILSIHFIIWVIREIRDTILKTWGSS